jgi:hypothetical protein
MDGNRVNRELRKRTYSWGSCFGHFRRAGLLSFLPRPLRCRCPSPLMGEIRRDVLVL